MLKFKTVSKIFGDNPAVKDIDFDVDEHEFVLVTGPSGSGKTTLMKLLIKEYTPTQGEIYYLGKSINNIKGRAIPQHRRQIGVVFQDYKLLTEYNIWENIALPLLIANKKQDEIERRVTDLLKLVQLTDKALMFPSQLSGGEAQRISIARALATGPKLIFADEPTGNLDPETSSNIIRLLQKINELGTTILLATHDKVVLDNMAKYRQIKLEKGKIVEDTQPKSKKKTEEKTSAEEETKNANKKEETTNIEKDSSSKETKKEENKEAKTDKEAQPSSEKEKTSDKSDEKSTGTRFGTSIKKITRLFGKK